MNSFVPVYKAKNRQKVKRNTRKMLRPARLARLTELSAERKAEALAMQAGEKKKWREHDREMEKMTEGCSVPD